MYAPTLIGRRRPGADGELSEGFCMPVSSEPHRANAAVDNVAPAKIDQVERQWTRTASATLGQ